jgi:tRNA 2-selenouridine synthase
VLGDLPDAPQPSQKMFDSLVWDRLRKFSAQRPVFVEAESKKIGNLRVPETLIAAMWQSKSIRLEAPVPVRTALLKDEYAHFLGSLTVLFQKLECLTALYGHGTISQWKALALDRKWEKLIEELLIRHYDPAYTRSTLKHYPALAHAPTLRVDTADDARFGELAEQCLALAH